MGDNEMKTDDELWEEAQHWSATPTLEEMDRIRAILKEIKDK